MRRRRVQRATRRAALGAPRLLLPFLGLVAACAGGSFVSSGGGTGPGVTQELSSPPIVAGRRDHTATRLASGEVLLVGGADAGNALVAQAERYVPRGQRFRATAGSPLVPRKWHTASRLDDGRVLLVGGFSAQNPAEARTELYDPATDRFTAGPVLQSARRLHTATVLTSPAGEVAVVGGDDGAGGAVGAVERFASDASAVQTVGTLRQARVRHRTVLFRDLLYVLGGETAAGVTASVEVFDPVSGTARLALGGLRTARQDFAVAVLSDGRILVVGGRGATGTALSDAEVYDPVKERSFGAGERLQLARGNPVAVRLFADTRVLVLGNSAATEIYEPARSRFIAGASLHTSRARPSATVLGPEVLIFGGAGSLTLAELFVN